MFNKKLGFTLSEVLIVLIVIGVIAALTVPSLINKINGEEYRAGLKKFVSEINQVLTMHYAETGEGIGDITNHLDDPLGYFSGIFMDRMHITVNEQDDSFPGGVICNDDGSAMTPDGMILCTDLDELKVSGLHGGNYCDSENKNPCSENDVSIFYLDVNGEKGPNVLTTDAKSPKDQYGFVLYDHKLVPYGVAQQVMYGSK